MKLNFKKLHHWFPVLLWMGIIFTLSSFEGAVVSQIHWIEFLIKKTIHMTEYAILWLFTFRALRHTTEFSLTKAGLIALLVAILYAATDEFHQTLVPTRFGTFRDVAIDATGAAIAFFATRNFSFSPKLSPND